MAFILNPRFLSEMAFYDLANNIFNQALEAGLEVIVKEALANGRAARVDSIKPLVESAYGFSA